MLCSFSRAGVWCRHNHKQSPHRLHQPELLLKQLRLQHDNTYNPIDREFSSMVTWIHFWVLHVWSNIVPLGAANWKILPWTVSRDSGSTYAQKRWAHLLLALQLLLVRNRLIAGTLQDVCGRASMRCIIMLHTACTRAEDGVWICGRKDGSTEPRYSVNRPPVWNIWYRR